MLPRPQGGIYVDDEDERYPGYWYPTFAKAFDCWDRLASDYDDDEAIGSGISALHGVYTYSLNTQLLDDTPLKDRLLFKMGGTLHAMIVCHKSLASIFLAGESNGVRLQAVGDY